MQAQETRQGYRMRSRARRWLAVAALIAACGLGAWGLIAPSAGNTAQAAAPAPAWGVSSQAQGDGKGIPGKLEGRGAEVKPAAPRYTTAPSPFEPLANPIFSPNVRANTDATTYAQQEPSIAVNPTNPLNVVASAKDER